MSYQQRQVNRSVFRAYDIRGVIGEDLDDDAYYSIGRAFACRLKDLKRDKVFLARDGRLTSDYLAVALRQGLLDSGIHVIDIGAVATPVLYYATHAHGVDSGLMVTGSHNPAQYNGIKMVLAGTTLVKTDIDLLFNLVEEGRHVNGQGQLQILDIMDDYQQRIVQDIELKRRLKVVIDGGNGIAGPVLVEVIKQLGCDVVPLYCDVDGHFPNHHPDPTVEANLLDLKAAVAAHQADIGLAFDGDADRLGVVTDSGTVMWPDRLMMFYAKEVLRHHPGATIVYDVKCSNHLTAVIEKAGGVAKMCPTGHSIVKGIMKKEKAVLAGEMSGHLFFNDRWYGFDDALYSACRLLEMVSQYPQTVTEQFSVIPDSVNTPEIKIEISDERKFEFMKHFSLNASFPGGKVVDIDGVRVEFPNGWGLIRASNTTPCLVARFEADDLEALQQIQSLFKSELNRLDSDLPFSF